MKQNWRWMVAIGIVLCVGIVIFLFTYSAPKGDGDTGGYQNQQDPQDTQDPQDPQNHQDEWAGYVEIFPDYTYQGAQKLSVKGRSFFLKDKPQNIAEELVAMNYYYDIAGKYDKLYEISGSKALKISAENTEMNYRDGQYVRKYTLNRLTTLTLAQFVQRDESMLEMADRAIKESSLSAYTLVRLDFTMKYPKGQEGQSQLGNGDYTFYFLCGKAGDNGSWKIYEVFWE